MQEIRQRVNPLVLALVRRPTRETARELARRQLAEARDQATETALRLRVEVEA